MQKSQEQATWQQFQERDWRSSTEPTDTKGNADDLRNSIQLTKAAMENLRNGIVYKQIHSF